MTDATSPEMAVFFRRYDRRNRILLFGALCVSLAMSAINLSHGADALDAPGFRSAPALWWIGIVFPPAFTVAWWGAMELVARWRKSFPARSADDASNGLRIANAGFAFNIALVAAGLGGQAAMTAAVLGYQTGDLIPRATMVAAGAATIYLGNLWPRLQTHRSPDGRAANLKINRIWGWIMVILGLGLVVQGLFLPLLYPFLRSLQP
jgi:hypothetical protein